MSACVVLDTNIVLDLWVFDDPRTHALRARIEAGAVRWRATAAMREELVRVLDYPQIAARRALHGLAAQEVLARFDRHAELVGDASPAPMACQDPDDQIFIDLAVAHGAQLWSKDRRVQALRRRLAAAGAELLTVPAPAAAGRTTRAAAAPPPARAACRVPSGGSPAGA